MTTDYLRKASLTHQLWTALRATLVFLLLCGLLYTGIATLMGGLLFPHQATGSLIQHQNQVVGSSLIGQPFVSPQYVYGRPSAANYDPRAASGSNLAASNPQLRERVQADSGRIATVDGVSPTTIPVDLVAASGSGLDPHISPAAARLQAPRIAAVRGLPEARIQEAIVQHTQGRQWGIFGQPRVNVLLLNADLDRLTIEAKSHQP